MTVERGTQRKAFLQGEVQKQAETGKSCVTECGLVQQIYSLSSTGRHSTGASVHVGIVWAAHVVAFGDERAKVLLLCWSRALSHFVNMIASTGILKRTLCDRSPQPPTTAMSRLKLTDTVPEPDLNDVEFWGSQGVDVVPRLARPPSPIERRCLATLQKEDTLALVVPEFVDFDQNALDTAWGSHRTTRGNDNVSLAKRVWDRWLAYKKVDSITEENAADLLIGYMRNVARKPGQTKNDFRNKLSAINTSIFTPMGLDMFKNDIVMLKARNEFKGLKQQLAKAQIVAPPTLKVIGFTESQVNQMLLHAMKPDKHMRTTYDTIHIIDHTISMWFGPRCRTKSDLTMRAILRVEDLDSKCQFKFIKAAWFDKTHREGSVDIQHTDNEQTCYCQCDRDRVSAPDDYCPVRELLEYTEALSTPDIMNKNKHNDSQTGEVVMTQH